jgi:hypothetical protein
MRIFFRVLLVIVLIAAVTGAIYYFVGQSKLEKKKVSEYLDENAVVYYDLNTQGVDKIIEMIDSQTEHLNVISQLPDSSLLKGFFTQDASVVSWHLTRQNTLSKVYWVRINEDYDIKNDTLFQVEKINNLYQISVANKKLFVAVSDSTIAIGDKGELIGELSNYDFTLNNPTKSMKEESVRGSWKVLQKYLKTRSEVFSDFYIDGKTYQLEFYSSKGVVFYNLLLDSVADLCQGMGKANFNGSLPHSTIAVWQSNFSNNNCMLDKHAKAIETQLWELEERYQIKVATIMDAWFDGSFKYMYCDFNGIKSKIASVKLKNDAAPFGSGSRFFVDYENLNIGNAMPQKSFTIARVIPEGLSQVVFTSSPKGKPLFVTQYENHLYFAQKRDPLVLLLNELITGNKLNKFDEVIPAQHHFFLRFQEALTFGQNDQNSKENSPKYFIQGKSLLQHNKLMIQGQIVLEK